MLRDAILHHGRPVPNRPKVAADVANQRLVTVAHLAPQRVQTHRLAPVESKGYRSIAILGRDSLSASRQEEGHSPKNHGERSSTRP